MNMRLLKITALIWVLLAIMGTASAREAIQTTVTMRVSKMTQNAVVNAGEDLSIDVDIDGVKPDSYQWYFNDQAIEGANRKVLNIVNAQPENAGLYRMDAFDESGAMVVSMDIAARVIEDTVPKSGDPSMPVGAAFGGMGLCAGAMFLLLRRRAML